MGRRAKLLKPRSWGAADICLFSISPPSIVLYPHFMVLILSARLRIPWFVRLLTPAPVLLAVLFLLILFLSVFLFFFFLILLPVVLPFFRVKPAGCLGPYQALQREFV